MRCINKQEGTIWQFVIAFWIPSYFDNVMTKFMLNNRTDTWKIDINLLILLFLYNWILFSILLGCFCVYGSLSSLDFVRDCLDEMTTRSKYDSVDDSNPMQFAPPTFLILARNPNNDDIIHRLRKEGQELASRYMWTAFVNISML